MARVTAATQRFRAWNPWTPPQAPSGSYDPTIDAQQSAVGRGLTDQQTQYGIANARELTDYGTGTAQIQQGLDRGLQDLGTQRQSLDTQFGRSQADLALNRSQEGENYQRNVDALTRNYRNLSDSQRQQQAKAGVLRGGAMLQAAAKRAANQQLDQSGLDLTHSRQLAAFDLAGQRLSEDRATQQTALDVASRRLGEDTGFQQSQLDLSAAPPSDPNNPLTGGRGYQDRTLALAQAQREAQQFGLDASAQRNFQATQNGWDPGGRAANEFTDPRTGQNYRDVVRGNTVFRIDPSGRVLSSRRRRAV